MLGAEIEKKSFENLGREHFFRLPSKVGAMSPLM